MCRTLRSVKSGCSPGPQKLRRVTRPEREKPPPTLDKNGGKGTSLTRTLSFVEHMKWFPSQVSVDGLLILCHHLFQFPISLFPSPTRALHILQDSRLSMEIRLQGLIFFINLKNFRFRFPTAINLGLDTVVRFNQSFVSYAGR